MDSAPVVDNAANDAEIAAHGHVLMLGRYVGAEEVEGSGDPWEEKMPRLVGELRAQFGASAKLEQAVKANLGGCVMGSREPIEFRLRNAEAQRSPSLAIAIPSALSAPLRFNLRPSANWSRASKQA